MDLASLKTYVLARAQEPSTLRGVVLFVTGVGVHVRPDLIEPIVTVGTVVAGAVGALLPDSKPKEPPQ